MKQFITIAFLLAATIGLGQKKDPTQALLKKVAHLSYRIDSLSAELESYKDLYIKERMEFWNKAINRDYLLSGYISEQRGRIDMLLLRVDALEKRPPFSIIGDQGYPVDIDPGFSPPKPAWPAAFPISILAIDTTQKRKP